MKSKAWNLSARDALTPTAAEGDTFTDLSTGVVYFFTEGRWADQLSFTPQPPVPDTPAPAPEPAPAKAAPKKKRTSRTKLSK